jgi:serine/threonine protein kinase/Tol biopolymer transport system component
MIGRTLGHYRVTDRLGEGGMGIVYRAEDLRLGRIVALKLLPPELTRDPDSKKRFEREAKAASQLDHPNICTILDFGESDDDGQMYFAMPCYDGESLAERVQHGPMPLDEAVRMIEQIARGLGKAHAQGIIHRDIKPDNVIVTRDGVAKILDFGLAKLALASRITKSNTTVGTAAYMSPEQIRGENVGPQADIWSLGVVFFELLTGRLPFLGEYTEALTYSILNEQPESIPEYPDADRIIKRMLRKDPLQRYQTIDEFLADLLERKRSRLEKHVLPSGARLGPYEILMPVSTSVYLAKDTRLDRHVAIKVLPPEFPQKDRFRRDAKAVSKLTHPNICTLFDVGEQEGVDYVVMEFLEGETLAQKKTPMPVPQVLKIGMQLADGLAAAHKAEVVHRDLRSANVMITKSGVVKLLDFGLARDAGAYLSPEQVDGKEVDSRADIFALGLLLYEIATGRPPFSAVSKAGLMAAILEHDAAPPRQIRSAIPPALDRLIRTCLEKNPDDRFETAHDVMLELRSMAETAPVARRRVPYGAIAAVLAVAALGYALYRFGGTRAAAPRPRTFTQLTFTEGLDMFPTIAPDGKSIAYVSSESGNRDVYLQRVDGRMATSLTSDSSVDDSEPAFSPDGSQIAFRSERDGGGIFIMGVSGESVRRLSDFGHNPAWSPDGKRIAVSTVGIELKPHSRTVFPGELWLVDVQTGAKKPLIQRGKGGPDFGRSSDAVQPSWSPHGKRIAFWGLSDEQSARDIWTIDPDAPQPKMTVVRVTSDSFLDWNPVWSPDGTYLYFGSNRDGTLNLWRIAIDEAKGTPSATPEPLSLPAPLTGNFSFSRGGDLAYLAMTRSHRLLAIPFDATGATTGTPRLLFGASQEIVTFQPSSDGKTIAFTTVIGANENLFVANADGSRLRRLTNDAVKDRGVQWSPDEKTLYFYSNRDGPYTIWSIRADGSGLARVTDEADLRRHGIRGLYLTDVSRDGRTLVAQATSSIVLVHLDRPIGKRVETLGAMMDGAKFSPDGNWLAGSKLDPRSTPLGIILYSMRTEQQELVLNHGISPLWLPDGKRVVFFERQNIGILDVSTRRVTTPPSAPHPGVDFTPARSFVSSDGSTLYVRQMLEQGNVWMVHFEK